jgi:protein-S-isoprenylcysteine O-methyltransferase Ste14
MPKAMNTGEIIITCWCVFFVVWIVTAAKAKRTVEMQSEAARLAHRLPVGLGWWLLLFPKFPGEFNRQILPRTEELRIVGAVICVCGLWFTLWARYSLAGNWSGDVTFKQEHELIRTGPYRFVRHPIYTGLLVMFVGTTLHIGQLRCLIGLPLVAIGFWIKLNQEERLLVRHFPEAYPNYRREVKALVPFVI